jgi:hypothetical protein
MQEWFEPKAHQPRAENWLPWKGSVSARVPWVLSLRLMRLWRRIPSLEKEQCFIFMFFGVKRYGNDMLNALKIQINGLSSIILERIISHYLLLEKENCFKKWNRERMVGSEISSV